MVKVTFIKDHPAGIIKQGETHEIHEVHADTLIAKGYCVADGSIVGGDQPVDNPTPPRLFKLKLFNKMKKWFSIFTMIVCMIAGNIAQAQVQVPKSKKLTLAADTLTNADTTTYNAVNPGGDRVVTWYVKVTKLSGTVAGSIYVYGSNDQGATYSTASILGDTLTDTGGTKVYRFTGTRSDQSYRLQIITSGTCSIKQESWYYSN